MKRQVPKTTCGAKIIRINNNNKKTIQLNVIFASSSSSLSCNAVTIVGLQFVYNVLVIIVVGSFCYVFFRFF